MDILQERDGDITVVKIAGRLDSAAAHAAETQLLGAVRPGDVRLVLDLTGLDYISSAGLRVLLSLAKQVQQAQGSVALFGLNGNVREVFSVSGFDTIFTVEPDRDAAMAAVR